ncbi:rhodanese-like domain-containing protein [Nioella aestuarii]|uniref:rhodanese-like domain-containing protein n=1 Tax=Nioella aestuarii TaxID=1662864 RepID=UPI003D7FB9E7
MSLTVPALAQDAVGITPDVMSVTVETASGPQEIARIQDNDHVIEDDWGRTSRPCPNFCIQPMIPAPGVTPIGELELLAALQSPEITVVDSRTPDWFYAGTIPGAVNMPYTEMTDRMGELGCEIDFDGWDCTAARDVALFCNGPWCGQSPTAIRRMIEAGYPADRIHYYRPGMQGWRMLGLTVTGGGS